MKTGQPNEPPINANHRNRWPQFRRIAFSTVLACSFALPGVTQAQTDNFDNYTTTGSFTAAGWVLSEMAPGRVTTTFPTVGLGKGLRIQADPVPGEAPAAAIWYRTTQYTNFYMAADLVAWADTNQSVALLARASIGDDPGGASGYMVNYNVTQWGDDPTSPRQGELQISVLSEPFSTKQLAIGEITLKPGRPYRIVFTGTNSQFRAQVYDLYDLTAPLIQMDAVDPNNKYANGVCGFMCISRNDETGAADVTLDNYVIGQYDPNPATVPTLAHPVPGTPMIETRTPAERFMNCYDPSGGIYFTASTFSTNVIDATATKLRLNGVDVSSQLVLLPAGPNLSGELPGTALQSHTVYDAQLEVQDVTGQKRSTNTFWFDTFSDDYLASDNVRIIEAEDYNYSNGLYQLDPIPLSGYDLYGDPIASPGVGYFDAAGVEGVDFHDNLTSPEYLWEPEFRPSDPVGLSQGMFPEIEDANDPFGEFRYSDFIRSQYATNNMLEYVVHRTEPGEWLNYTRDFDAGNYHAWLRVASLGSTEVSLDQVTSDPSLPGQTTVNLGKFEIPNEFTRYNYRYIPLVDDSGSPAVLTLSGLTTLRLTMGGTLGQDNNKLAINYMLFVPVPVAIHVLSSATIGGPYSEETGATVDTATHTITVPASGSARFYRLNSGTALTIESISVSDGAVTMKY